jgi:hypothetical protein
MHVAHSLLVSLLIITYSVPCSLSHLFSLSISLHLLSFYHFLFRSHSSERIYLLLLGLLIKLTSSFGAFVTLLVELSCRHSLQHFLSRSERKATLPDKVFHVLPHDVHLKYISAGRTQGGVFL